MSDCLLTTLKGTVLNNNLPVFAALKFRVHIPSGVDYTATNMYFRADPEANTGRSVTVKIDGNGFFRTSRTDATSLGKELTVTGPQGLFPSIGDYDIIISNYYDVSFMSFFFLSISGCTAEPIPSLHIDTLQYMPYLTYFDNIPRSGDNIKKVVQYLTFTDRFIFQEKDYGTVKSLSVRHDYTRLDFSASTTVTGDLCSLLAAMWNEGRKSSTCTLVACAGLKFADIKTLTSNYTTVATFSDDGIVVTSSGGTVIECTYNGSSWS